MKFLIMILAMAIAFASPVADAAAPKKKRSAPEALQTGGRGLVWTQDMVTVDVYTPVAWLPTIEEGFDMLEAAMPRKGPAINVVYRGEVACDDIIRTRSIAVCNRDVTLAAAAYVEWDIDGNTFGPQGVRMTLDTRSMTHPRVGTYNLYLILHEGMHALSGVADCYGCHPDSCVQGTMLTVGAWDMQYLRHVYNRHDVKKPKGRGKGNKR